MRLLATLEASVDKLAVQTNPESLAERARYAALTDREREITASLIAGASSKTAGISLGISPRTVDVFRAKILRKMQVGNVAALAALVTRHRLS